MQCFACTLLIVTPLAIPSKDAGKADVHDVDGNIHAYDHAGLQVERRHGLGYLPQRSPAWCDRILYRSNLPLKQIKPVAYFSAPDVSSSDHKPVAAVLTVPTVWRTSVAEQEQQLRAAGGQQKGAFAFAFSGEGKAASAVPQMAGMRLVFTRLSIRGLLMGRSRRASITSAQLPNPQLVFEGPCMAAPGILRTSVRKLTRTPWWCSPPPPSSMLTSEGMSTSRGMSTFSPPLSPNSNGSHHPLKSAQTFSAKALGVFLRQVSALAEKDKLQGTTALNGDDSSTSRRASIGNVSGTNLSIEDGAATLPAHSILHAHQAADAPQQPSGKSLDSRQGIASFIATKGKMQLARSPGSLTAGSGGIGPAGVPHTARATGQAVAEAKQPPAESNSMGNLSTGQGFVSTGQGFVSSNGLSAGQAFLGTQDAAALLGPGVAVIFEGGPPDEDGTASAASIDEAGPSMYSAPLRRAAFSEMAHFRLWVRVLDHQVRLDHSCGGHGCTPKLYHVSHGWLTTGWQVHG